MTGETFYVAGAEKAELACGATGAWTLTFRAEQARRSDVPEVFERGRVEADTRQVTHLVQGDLPGVDLSDTPAVIAAVAKHLAARYPRLRVGRRPADCVSAWTLQDALLIADP